MQVRKMVAPVPDDYWRDGLRSVERENVAKGQVVLRCGTWCRQPSLAEQLFLLMPHKGYSHFMDCRNVLATMW